MIKKVLVTLLVTVDTEDESQIRRELKELINAGLTLSAASKYIAKKKNLTKSVIYNLY